MGRGSNWPPWEKITLKKMVLLAVMGKWFKRLSWKSGHDDGHGNTDIFTYTQKKDFKTIRADEERICFHIWINESWNQIVVFKVCCVSVSVLGCHMVALPIWMGAEVLRTLWSPMSPMWPTCYLQPVPGKAGIITLLGMAAEAENRKLNCSDL